MLSGISVSNGLAFGKALIFKKKKIIINKNKILEKNIENEIKKFLSGIKKTIIELEEIKYKNKIYDNENEIFNSHIMILEDDEFRGEIINLIKFELFTADAATNKIINEQIEIFKKMKDDYLKERANDIFDIGERLIKNILKINSINLNNIEEEVILISKDLTPSEIAQLNFKKVLGFITEFGSVTSHTSIMAKSFEIPAIVNVPDITKIIKNNDYIVLDSINNEIYINPDLNTINLIKKKREKYLNKKKKLKKIKNLPAVTKDGHRISLLSNICNIDDIENVLKHGAEGIGLYRTEFLYMNRDDLPNEKEQFNSYKYITEKMGNKKVTIRIMDIGGDKNIPYLKISKEDNPFLGWRAIRILMDHKEILYTQLKAILLASEFGNIRIMFPMIISLEEVRYLKKEFEKIKKELLIKEEKKIEIGVMIETPAAALIIKDLSKEVDFFSIGTNDLTQYTLAVDRGNKLVSHLYNPLSPSILKLIKKIIDDAHKNGKKVGMCGELSSDKNATLLLLGLGLDEFSMSSSYIPYIKNIIRKNNFVDAKKIANKALRKKTVKDLKKYLDSLNKKNN